MGSSKSKSKYRDRMMMGLKQEEGRRTLAFYGWTESALHMKFSYQTLLSNTEVHQSSYGLRVSRVV